MSTAPDLFHIGRKIRRIREIKGMKQDALASEIGVSRQTLSKIEQSESIDDTTLSKVANALGVPSEAIRAFNEDAAIFNISCNFNDHAVNTIYQFNPIEKIVQLYDEKIILLERLLQNEKENYQKLHDLIDKLSQRLSS